MVSVMSGSGFHSRSSGNGSTASAQVNKAQLKYKSFVHKHHIDNKNIFARIFDRLYYRHRVEIPCLKSNENFLDLVDYLIENVDFCKNNKIKGKLQFESSITINGKLKLDSNRFPVFIFHKRKDALRFKLRQTRSRNG